LARKGNRRQGGGTPAAVEEGEGGGLMRRQAHPSNGSAGGRGNPTPRNENWPGGPEPRRRQSIGTFGGPGRVRTSRGRPGASSSRPSRPGERKFPGAAGPPAGQIQPQPPEQ